MAAATAVCALTLACAPALKRTGPAPSASEMAQFWVDPGPAPRDLAVGPLTGEDAPTPATDARFEVLKRDPTGFSITYRVRDQQAREWSVKIGPEAQTEVVSSRIVWALGFHAVPSQFVERWIGVDHGKGQALGGGRFRPRKLGLKSLGEWSWHRNPFVGTRPYNGLLALMMILNSTDLKDQNNEVYDLPSGPREGARRWYVVKDLGASLGETGRMDPRRGWVDGFEREPFITGEHDGRVEFGYRGRHQELLAGVGVEDVHWTCERLQRVTARQWHDAFRAGNFTSDQTDRYVRRIHQKIAEGLALR